MIGAAVVGLAVSLIAAGIILVVLIRHVRELERERAIDYRVDPDPDPEFMARMMDGLRSIGEPATADRPRTDRGPTADRPRSDRGRGG